MKQKTKIEFILFSMFRFLFVLFVNNKSELIVIFFLKLFLLSAFIHFAKLFRNTHS